MATQNRVNAQFLLACTAASSAEQIAWTVPQLHAIRSDPGWRGGDYYDARPGDGPHRGLGVARRIAHVTYRSEPELSVRFGHDHQDGEHPWEGGRYAVESYLDHHADKLVWRFDAGSYVTLTEAMNSHDIGRGRGGTAAALSAQAGLFGGGGLGNFAITYGSQRYEWPIVYITVATIIVIVQAGQFVGNWLARRALRR